MMNETPIIAPEEPLQALLATLRTCVIEARDSNNPTPLASLRLAMRGLAPVLRLAAHTADGLSEALIILHAIDDCACVQEKNSAFGSYAAYHQTLAYRAIHLTCQLHLARIAEQHYRALQRAQHPHHIAAPCAEPATDTLATGAALPPTPHARPAMADDAPTAAPMHGLTASELQRQQQIFGNRQQPVPATLGQPPRLSSKHPIAAFLELQSLEQRYGLFDRL